VQRLPLTQKIFTKTSKHENIHDCLSRLFYFNNELRLEHNKVENKHLHHDEKKKRRFFIENGKYIFNGVPHQYQILLYQEGIKKSLTTDQNLIKESASH
jgi:hypothetical protein